MLKYVQALKAIMNTTKGNLQTQGTIDKLVRDLQEEFINAEIKIEDKKSLYPQQGQRGSARHH
eukprot:Pgem_evm2s19078